MATNLSEDLHGELRQLRSRVGGLRGALLASTDGFGWARELHPELDDQGETLAAMVASMLGLGQHMVGVIGGDQLNETTIRSDAGNVCIYAVGDDAVLTVLADQTVKLSRVHVESRRSATRLADFLVA